MVCFRNTRQIFFRESKLFEIVGGNENGIMILAKFVSKINFVNFNLSSNTSSPSKFHETIPIWGRVHWLSLKFPMLSQFTDMENQKKGFPLNTNDLINLLRPIFKHTLKKCNQLFTQFFHLLGNRCNVQQVSLTCKLHL